MTAADSVHQRYWWGALSCFCRQVVPSDIPTLTFCDRSCSRWACRLRSSARYSLCLCVSLSLSLSVPLCLCFCLPSQHFATNNCMYDMSLTLLKECWDEMGRHWWFHKETSDWMASLWQWWIVGQLDKSSSSSSGTLRNDTNMWSGFGCSLDMQICLGLLLALPYSVGVQYLLPLPRYELAGYLLVTCLPTSIFFQMNLGYSVCVGCLPPSLVREKNLRWISFRGCSVPDVIAVDQPAVSKHWRNTDPSQWPDLVHHWAQPAVSTHWMNTDPSQWPDLVHHWAQPAVSTHWRNTDPSQWPDLVHHWTLLCTTVAHGDTHIWAVVKVDWWFRLSLDLGLHFVCSSHFVLVGSRPSDHYFRSVCWFVCLFVQSFS